MGSGSCWKSKHRFEFQEFGQPRPQRDLPTDSQDSQERCTAVIRPVPQRDLAQRSALNRNPPLGTDTAMTNSNELLEERVVVVQDYGLRSPKLYEEGRLILQFDDLM